MNLEPMPAPPHGDDGGDLAGPAEMRPRPVRDRSRLASFYRNRVRPLFSRRLSRLAALVVPHLYLGYMRLVWATSRVEGGREFYDIVRIAEENDGAVGLLWHEEVFSVAWAYPYLGILPHTLASLGESGEVIARMLKLCGYVVFRGGSTSGTSRRREGTLREMIEHMKENRCVIYGLTVDGSKGPAYRMKTGGIVIARECGVPILLARTWYRRCLRLPTWDRMAIPLPFNVVRYYLRGPYRVPEDADTEPGLLAFRDRLEDDLVALALESYRDAGQRPPANLVRRDAAEGRIAAS